MPYRRGRGRFKSLSKLPMNYVKHCVEEISNIAANTGRSEIVCLAPLGDETTTTIGTRTRDVNVTAGDKVFSIDYEIVCRPTQAGTEAFYEVAWTFHRSPDVLSIETADVNASGLAKDLIGRYSGNCLYTAIIPVAVNVGGKIRGKLKLPKTKRSFRVGDSLICTIHNHSSVTTEYIGKYIYKSYH